MININADYEEIQEMPRYCRSWMRYRLVQRSGSVLEISGFIADSAIGVP